MTEPLLSNNLLYLIKYQPRDLGPKAWVPVSEYNNWLHISQGMSVSLLTHHFAELVSSQSSLTKLEEYYHFLNKPKLTINCRVLPKKMGPEGTQRMSESKISTKLTNRRYILENCLCAIEALLLISTYACAHTITTCLCVCTCTQIYTPPSPSQPII